MRYDIYIYIYIYVIRRLKVRYHPMKNTHGYRATRILNLDIRRRRVAVSCPSHSYIRGKNAGILLSGGLEGPTI